MCIRDRKFVKRTAPELSEAVKWGNGCWLGKKGPVAYVYSDTGFVQFGFFRGAALIDAQGLLEGKGQYVRHIKVRSPSGIDEQAFAALLRQAAGSKPGRPKAKANENKTKATNAGVGNYIAACANEEQRADRGRELVVYIFADDKKQKALLSRLGKHKMGKSC